MIGMTVALFMICLVEQSGVRRRGGMAAETCGSSWSCVSVRSWCELYGCGSLVLRFIGGIGGFNRGLAYNKRGQLMDMGAAWNSETLNSERCRVFITKVQLVSDSLNSSWQAEVVPNLCVSCSMVRYQVRSCKRA